MKPNQYVKKYRLNQTIDFRHDQFISDFTLDYLSLLEYFKQGTNFTMKHFEECTNQMRDKWESIANKSIGIDNPPEKLWGYFYATVIMGAKDDCFPQIREREKEIDGMSIEELADYLQGYDYWAKPFTPNMTLWMLDSAINSCERGLKDENRQHVRYALNKYLKRAKGFLPILQEKDERRRAKAQEQWWQQFWDRQKERQRSWRERVLELVMQDAVPTAEFQLLGLAVSATVDEIKSAYRTLAHKWHPDKGGSHDKFINITQAKDKCLAWVSKK